VESEPGTPEQEELLDRVRDWIRATGSPLPVDLYTELLRAGLDANHIEDQLRKEEWNNGT
jgi:hypothetical protein